MWHSFYMLLNFIHQHFVKEFIIYIYDILVCSFLFCTVIVWFDIK